MPKDYMVVAALLATGLLTSTASGAQQPKSAILTDKDRAEIRELMTSYGRALGMCAPEEYAALFASPDGYFASGPRGRVAGRDKLMELVRSERHCNDGSEKRPRNMPSDVAIEPTVEGATGRASVANAGHYEDTYVKAAQGWRFKGRTYISPQEEAAKLTAVDFNEIRRLAGNDSGQFQDVYSTSPQGRQFRSSGVVITPSPEGATGRGYLKNEGGRYDDVYEKTAQGWRFKSRQHVVADQAAIGAGAQAVAGPSR